MTGKVDPESRRKARRTAWLLAAFAVVVFGLFIFRQWYFIHHARPTPPDLADYHGVIYPKGRTIGDFRLRAPDDSVFKASALKGQWTFLVLGDSRCGASCDQALNPLQTFLDRLNPQWPRPRILIVDDDPVLDTPAIRRRWSASLGNSFLVVGGEEAQLRALMEDLKHGFVVGETRKSSTPPTLALVNPAGRLQALFRPPYEADLLASGYIRTVHWYRATRNPSGS